MPTDPRARSRSRGPRRVALRFALTTAILGGGPAAIAADFTVNTFNDSGTGSLREAIENANADPTGEHTISFDGGLGNGTILLDSMLPMVQLGTGGNLTITGPGTANLAISGQSQHRILFVDSGDVTVEGITLRDGRAGGGAGGSFGGSSAGGGGGGLGAGGALFVNENGNVVLHDVSLADNTASGGKGGGYSPNSNLYAGGGGGGFGGDGGEAGETGGGGGGGFAGNGGNGAPSPMGRAGGGGGGLSQDGAAGNGNTGGAGGGEGSDGADIFLNAANGARFGGGGGGGESGNPGDGGDFGGGGGGGWFRNGGTGGFGGGGGGAGENSVQGGAGGFGAGDGGFEREGGDGGDGLGGAVFVRQGGEIRFENVAFSGNLASAGNGGTGSSAPHNGSDGEADGAGLFAMTSVQATWMTPEDEDATLDPSLMGGAGLVKTGNGLLNLAGNSGEFDSLTVDGGTLRVNTGVTSDVTVNSGGTLGGAGSITGQLFLNGTLAPGNSIGTLTVNGNTTFNAGSTTEIEINDGGNAPGVNNDLIDVNGDVTISGGSIAVSAATGDYTGGTTYTFLTADSVTGTFDSITDNLAFFDASLTLNADNVQFSLLANGADFASVGESFNQRYVGGYIDTLSGSAPPPLQTLLDEMAPMTTGQVQSSLDQLGGAMYGSLATANLQHTTHYLSQLSDRVRAQMVPAEACRPHSVRTLHGVELSEPETWGGICNPSEMTAWVSGYGLGGRGQSDGNADGFNSGLGGTQIAVQRNLDAQHSLGGWANLAWSNVRGENLNESADLENYHFGSYLTGFDGRNYYLINGGLGLPTTAATRLRPRRRPPDNPDRRRDRHDPRPVRRLAGERLHRTRTVGRPSRLERPAVRGAAVPLSPPRCVAGNRRRAVESGGLGDRCAFAPRDNRRSFLDDPPRAVGIDGDPRIQRGVAARVPRHRAIVRRGVCPVRRELHRPRCRPRPRLGEPRHRGKPDVGPGEADCSPATTSGSTSTKPSTSAPAGSSSLGSRTRRHANLVSEFGNKTCTPSYQRRRPVGKRDHTPAGDARPCIGFPLIDSQRNASPAVSRGQRARLGRTGTVSEMIAEQKSGRSSLQRELLALRLRDPQTASPITGGRLRATTPRFLDAAVDTI